MDRAQQSIIIKDLHKKLVILVGPRQAGKTWLAKNIQKHFKSSTYLNYDAIADRAIIHKQAWLPSTELLIFDELHKMPNWKNYLKGLYDTKSDQLKILVTGSASLEVYSLVGDSLAGRYFRHRLLPISPAEVFQVGNPVDLEQFLLRGGFPEPYLADDDVDAARWRVQYVNSLLTTDVFELAQIHNLKAMRLVFELLRSRVGSTISYQSLAEDVSVSPATIKKYIQILEALFIIFRITPYSKNIARSLLKEPKIYFFDTGLVNGHEGAKLENLVATSLLKHCYIRNDQFAEDYQLHYIRNKDKQEVDFVLSLNGLATKIIEVKLSDHDLSPTLKKFHAILNVPAVQVVKNIRNAYQHGEIIVLSAREFLGGL